jgi:hypothetical protein
VRIDRCAGCGNLINIVSDHKPDCLLLVSRRSPAEEVLQLQREFNGKQHTDPVFRAQLTITGRVLSALDSMGRLTDDRGNERIVHEYAAFIITAAQNKFHPMRQQLAEAYNRGMADQKLVEQGIRTPGRNPYEGEQ